jgi:glycosyltransferase involved in cell wall biosynthesis
MHILIIPAEHFITNWSPLGGIFQNDLAQALSRKNFRVGILSVGKFPSFKIFRGWKYHARELIGNVTVCRRYIELPIPYRFDSHLLIGQIFSKIASDIYDSYVLEFGKPDIIHAHNFRYAGYVAADLSKRKNVPFVVTEHSSAYSSGEISGGLARRLAKVALTASRVSAVSSSFGQTLSQVLKLNQKKLTVIPNLLADEFLLAPTWHKTLNDNAEFVFLNVAELVPIKNQRLLLDAFAAIFKGSNVRLRIVGDGPCKPDLHRRIEELNLSSQVDMIGRLSRLGVRDEMRKADCFVLSSNSETFGVVLIEALSQGLPVISTSCGGPSDILNEKNGILTGVGDLHGLENAMYTMRNNREQFHSRAISNECYEHYGEDAVVNQYTRFYMKAIDEYTCRSIIL